MTRHVVLSEKAVAIMNAPPVMPMVEDIYSIGGKREWFVVCTEPQRETKVVKELSDKGVSLFMPLTREWKKRSKLKKHQAQRMEQIERPLLSGYLFVELPVKERQTPFNKIRDVDGVQGILGTSSGPMPVDGRLVDLLRERQDAGDFDRTVKRRRVIAPAWAQKGVRVQIKDGPFSSLWGIIERCLPRDVVQVAIELFGRTTPVKLELAQIEKPC